MAESRTHKDDCLIGGAGSGDWCVSTLAEKRGKIERYSKWFLYWGVFLLLFLLGACADSASELATRGPLAITIKYDDQTKTIPSTAGNIREFLDENGIPYGPSDLIDPPPFTPLIDDAEITIVRVSESIENLERTVPFQRRTVRNESMSADDPPVIIQSGLPGLQEITVRIVFHDLLEFSRQETQVVVVEPAVDEIVMIGVGAAPGNIEFDGILSVISGGNAVVMRGSSSYPEPITTGNDLDYRVFALSPTGSHLLYTRATTDTDQFNSLWVVGTERGDVPRSVGINNVLWAAWNPERIGELQIAYTTGKYTDIPPGWEANNDLWIGDLPQNRFAEIETELIVEAYPATYGWWGGNYVWSPAGRYIAYSYADEIGVIDTFSTDPDEQRIRLHSFTEYNTRSDWVWVPPISWSPEGIYLAFAQHAGDDPNTTDFETWVVDATNGVTNRFVEQSGMWSMPSWSPLYSDPLMGDQDMSQIAFLRATDPLDSQRSSYTLWLMDRDASNVRQLYPPAGENSRFPRGGTFMAWGPDGRDIAFVYDDALYIIDLDGGEARRITQDDNVVRNPTWAPYGPAAFELLKFGEGATGAVLQLTDPDDIPSD
ncbi:MAG: DPP IV N-terminal domain-containing protein [Candidatus Promineifilaceae bacterium]